MEAELFKVVIQYGLAGVVIIGLSYWIFRKDRQQRADHRDHIAGLKTLVKEHETTVSELNKEHEQKLETARQVLREEQTLRLEDAKRFTDMALELQKEAIAYAGKIDDMVRETAVQNKVVERLVGALDRTGGVHPR